MNLAVLDLGKYAFLRLVCHVSLEHVFKQDGFQNFERVSGENLSLVSDAIVQVKIDNPYNIDKNSCENDLNL